MLSQYEISAHGSENLNAFRENIDLSPIFTILTGTTLLIMNLSAFDGLLAIDLNHI
jgi:hypothetical protein